MTGLPRAFEGMSFDQLRCDGRDSLSAAVRVCIAYAEAPSGWLTLYGPPGVGKTHLGVAILRAQPEPEWEPGSRRPTSWLYADWSQTLQDIKATWDRPAQAGNSMYSSHSPAPSEADWWQELYETPLLFMDDIGAESGSDWAQSCLFRLVNARYMSRLPTVWATNLDISEMDGRVGSRLRDWQLGQTLLINEADYRIHGRPVARVL